ncbi:MAG: rRNA (guanine2445-N2)-methyltransferase [Acidobacteriota bacterium]|nr:rRNA (guanine2445-N2)-methyltransferase [Acidobacteriota bacterium]
MSEPLHLVATCVLGLEEFVDAELAEMGMAGRERQRGAVTFTGSWEDCWRANWRLRTANRVLVELGRYTAVDGPGLAAGALSLVKGRAGRTGTAGIDPGALLHPDRSFSIHATVSDSPIRDARWAALSVKDGLVDGQRERYGRRADVDRQDPDLHLRLRLHATEAILLLDTSGEPLDRRGYREVSAAAPVREQLAAACVLASGWDGTGPVVDPLCGSGTLLIEAAWFALGLAPGSLRLSWAFERLPGFDAAAFERLRREPLPAPGPGVRLYGNDLSPAALRAARTNLDGAGLAGRATLIRGDFRELAPPAEGPGLVLANPPYGERVREEEDQWRALGDLLKQRFKGWRAAILAGGQSRGKGIGLRPRRRIPVWNGPIEARILLFDLF